MGVVQSGIQTTRGFGFCLPPYPAYTYIVDQILDATNPGYGDTVTGGTTFLQPFSATPVAAPLAPPNIAAVLGTTSGTIQRTRIRCTGLSLTCTYEGTELNRAGKYIAALVPLSGVGTVYAATGTKVGPVSSALATTTGFPNFQLSDLRQQAVKYVEQRVSDKTFVCRWIPQGAPSYQLARPFVSADVTTAAGVQPASSVWNTSEGDFGVQEGQSALIFMMDGDTTGVSGNSGNLYTVNINWNWEVIPDNPESVAYGLSSSPANQGIMDHCLNAFQALTITPTPGNGTAAY